MLVDGTPPVGPVFLIHRLEKREPKNEMEETFTIWDVPS